MKTPFPPLLCSVLLALASALSAHAAHLPVIEDVELQPLAAQARRLIEATDYLGAPLSSVDKAALQRAINSDDAPKAARAIQETLDRHCLFLVTISPEMRVKGAQGPAKPELVEHGWRQFLVKVVNESGTTAPLQIVSPNAQSVHNARVAPMVSDRAVRKGGPALPAVSTAEAWLDLQTFDQQPLKPTLDGLKVEYRTVQLYSRDAGKREARFNFSVGQGTQDIGFRKGVGP